MLSSRTKHLQRTLEELNFTLALKAFDLVISEMCAEKGYARLNGKHYYHHLVDVTQKLINYRFIDEDIITAALLHDIVEDVPSYDIEWTRTEFNDNIAHMVELLTKKPGVDYKKPSNIKKYLEDIFNNYGASLVKTADRIHNFGTLADFSLEKKIRYATETEKFYIPFFKKCRGKYPSAAFFYFEAKTQIEANLLYIKLLCQRELELLDEINQLQQLNQNKY
jgi:guanosine-3',5'-bis(diphosphate) 3'-pyrophosphohydrolase